jgi:hypothetical protein
MCLSKILQTLPGVEIVTVDYVCKLRELAVEINCRFSDLRASFAFLENPFLVDVMKNGFPVVPGQVRGSGPGLFP